MRCLKRHAIASILLSLSTNVLCDAEPVIVCTGSNNLVIRDIELPADIPNVPGHLQIFTELPDGSTAHGLWAVNRTGGESSVLTYRIPVVVAQRDDGGYEVAESRLGLLHASHGSVLPGAMIRLPGRDSHPTHPAATQITRAPGHSHRGGLSLIYSYDANAVTATYGQGSLLPFASTMTRVEQRLESLFADSRGSIIIRIRFDDPMGVFVANPQLGAATFTPHSCIDLEQSIDQVGTVAGNDGEANAEIQYYDSFLGATVPWDHSPTQTSLDASCACIPDSLLTHLFFAGGDPIVDIFVNTNFAVDLDETDGLDQAAGLESGMTHESLHALGFTSRGDLDLSALPADSVFLMDLFRFDDTAGAVSATEVRTSPRQLRPDRQANLAASLNTSLSLFAMSRGSRPGGDTFQPDHWRQFLLPPATTPIGIMDPDPALAAGNAIPLLGKPATRKYLTIADVRAMDVTGWNINHFAFDDDLPGEPGAFMPANAAIDVSLEPTLSWANGSDTTNTHVSIFDDAGLAASSRIYQASDLGSQQSITVPPSTLQAGQVYYWFVTAENMVGFTYSELLSFTTAGGPCNEADLAIPFGELDFSDVLAFNVAFAAMDPAADLAEPFGVFDFSDVIVFLNAFNAGCP